MGIGTKVDVLRKSRAFKLFVAELSIYYSSKSSFEDMYKESLECVAIEKVEGVQYVSVNPYPIIMFAENK